MVRRATARSSAAQVAPATPTARRTNAGGMASRKRSTAPAAESEGINPKAPCPCGSGRRYKHCHGSGYAPPVIRSFEGLPGEATGSRCASSSRRRRRSRGRRMAAR